MSHPEQSGAYAASRRGAGLATRLTAVVALYCVLLLGALFWLGVHHARESAGLADGFAAYAAAIGAAALLLLALAWLAIRRLVRPLAEVTAQVEALAAGAADLEPLALDRADELGRLSAAFDRLLADLARSQRELRASAERFRLAFKTSPEPLTLARLDGGEVLACNDGFLALHGLTEEQVIGRRTVDLGLWADPAERAAILAELRAGRPVRARDVRVRAAGGVVRTLAYSASIVELGREAFVLALSRDVTEERAAAAERERLATALRESEERYRSVVRSVPVVQWAIGLDDRFTHSEGKGLAALGLQPGQVVGLSVYEVYRDQPGVLADYRRARAGEAFVAVNDLGAVVFESHWAPLRDGAGAVVGVTGIALDVSARRKAEAELRQAQKMEAVGRLASGIAHDFNNLLVVILGGCEHLQGRAGDPTVQALAGEMLEAGQRAATLVRQLLAFGRKGPARPVPTTWNAVVAGFEKLLRRTLGERVALEVSLARAPWTLRADPQQLEQVLLNLAVNARDAMPEGGVLRIAAGNLQDELEAGGRRWCRLLVSDTGAGIPAEARDHIFEPFFSTKGGRGTGLGLATAFAIVDQAGGRIEVESAPGHGSTFTVLLPAVDEAPEEVRGAAERPLPAGAGRRVLVVEDDPTVRRSTARMLRELGFEALEAEAPEEALRRVEAGGVDAVVTDVVMPELTGPELARRLQALAPGLPVVFTSGYMDRQLHQLPEGASFLAKPFTLAQLARRLAEALGGR